MGQPTRRVRPPEYVAWHSVCRVIVSAGSHTRTVQPCETARMLYVAIETCRAWHSVLYRVIDSAVGSGEVTPG